MADTANLTLPLVAPAQAQKHVTVNEALVRLDALAQLSLASISTVDPPVSPAEGVAYAIPAGATGDWAGQEGQIAIWSNGGWIFVEPRPGWRAFVQDRGSVAISDGAGWQAGALSLAPGGGGLAFRSASVDVSLTPGSSVTTETVFPARAIAFGVTGRVVAGITGTATAWELGVSGDTGRYGTGLGTGLNASVSGPTAPFVYWSDTPLEITATGGSFEGGTLRLVAHFAELSLPDLV